METEGPMVPECGSYHDNAARRDVTEQSLHHEGAVRAAHELRAQYPHDARLEKPAVAVAAGRGHCDNACRGGVCRACVSMLPRKTAGRARSARAPDPVG